MRTPPGKAMCDRPSLDAPARPRKSQHIFALLFPNAKLTSPSSKTKTLMPATLGSISIHRAAT